MPLLVLPQPFATSNTFATPAGVSNLPNIAVEWSPTTNPNSTPVWVDVSSYLRAFDCHRGRQHELDQFEPGVATILLDNRLRTFDPSYTAGPYYGNLLPMRRIRIRAQYGNITYPIFTGYIENIEQQFAPPYQSVVQITASDALKTFAMYAPKSPHALAVRTGVYTPKAWWEIDEAASATVMYDSSGAGYDGAYSGGPTLNQTGLVVGSTCASFDGSNDTGTVASAVLDTLGADTIGTTGDVGAMGEGSDATVDATSAFFEMWMSTSTAANQAILTMGDGTKAVLCVWMDSAGKINVQADWNPNVWIQPRAVQSASAYNDGSGHQIGVIVAHTGPIKNIITLMVDGAIVSAPAIATTSLQSPRGWSIGSRNSTWYFTGKIDEVIVYTPDSLNVTTAVALLLDHYNAGANPWNNDATGTRIGRILDGVDWPTEERTIDTGNSTLQAASFSTSDTVLGVFQTINQTEDGLLFVNGSGKVVFKQRQSTFTGSSVGTFGDQAGEIRYTNVVLDYDESLIRNEVTIQRVGGNAITISDSTSQAKYFRRSYSQTSLLYASDNDSRDMAQWTLNRYKDPALRVSSMTLTPGSDPTNLYPHALGREIGDRVTVNRRPQGIGTVISQTLNIEGVHHSFTVSPSMYKTEFALSGAITDSFWILDDTTFSVLDSTTRVAF